MTTKPSNVLFICTGNIARSQMAEAIANQQFGKQLQASSAGSQPKSEIHPLTVQTLKDNGLNADGLRPKGVNDFANQPFDLVITLCDSACTQPCPSFPGNPDTVHWSVPDPAGDPTPNGFNAIFEALVETIGYMVHGPNPELAGRAKEAGRELARRFAPKAA